MQRTPIKRTRQKITKSKLDQAPPKHQVLAACELVRMKKQRNLCSKLLSQQLTKKLLKKQSWPKFHPPTELSRMQPNTSEKIKETRAVNSNDNNSPKNYPKNLSWTKLHPPTKFEPCAPYHLWEAQTNKPTHPQRIVYIENL